MPNGNPRDGFFYPTLTLMIDSYNTSGIKLGGDLGEIVTLGAEISP